MLSTDEIVKLVSDFNFDPKEENFVLDLDDEVLKDVLSSILSEELFQALKITAEKGQGIVNLSIEDIITAVIRRTLATKAILVKHVKTSEGEF